MYFLFIDDDEMIFGIDIINYTLVSKIKKHMLTFDFNIYGFEHCILKDQVLLEKYRNSKYFFTNIEEFEKPNKLNKNLIKLC